MVFYIDVAPHCSFDLLEKKQTGMTLKNGPNISQMTFPPIILWIFYYWIVQVMINHLFSSLFGNQTKKHNISVY